jgi:hypothetical protein
VRNCKGASWGDKQKGFSKKQKLLTNWWIQKKRLGFLALVCVALQCSRCTTGLVLCALEFCTRIGIFHACINLEAANLGHFGDAGTEAEKLRNKVPFLSTVFDRRRRRRGCCCACCCSSSFVGFLLSSFDDKRKNWSKIS